MARVITFSTKFPSYHKRKGEDTNFAQKFWTSISVPLPVSVDAEKLEREVQKLMSIDWKPKHHTIRMGNRWKVGDFFSPRIWSGKPYNSKQLILAEDVEIKKIWSIESTGNNCLLVNGKSFNFLDVEILAMNDGLSTNDLLDWFQYPKPFKGQIICWNDKNVSYDK